jgi:argininosuccinate lyase
MSPPMLIVETSMHAFNQSLSYDQRMHAVDVKGSIAYAKSLTLVGILDKEEETKIISGLLAVEKEWEDGSVRQSVSLRFFSSSIIVQNSSG